MGHVYQRVELAAVHEEELTILVDTGATYSLILPSPADRLGVSRLPRKQTIILADGRRIGAEVGTVIGRIGDRSAATTGASADSGEPLASVEALASLGRAFTPRTRAAARRPRAGARCPRVSEIGRWRLRAMAMAVSAVARETAGSPAPSWASARSAVESDSTRGAACSSRTAARAAVSASMASGHRRFAT